MKTVAVNGLPRTELGKKGVGAVRRDELIPCVMYGGAEVFHFSTEPLNLRDLVYTPDFVIADISLEGASYRAIVKHVQYHPVTDKILHVDFLRLIDGTSLKIELPIRFKGISPGVKAGGKLIQQLRRVLVKTLPEKLIPEMLVDISTLELGQSIRVRDIQVEPGIEVLVSPSVPVAMIEIPRALRSATTAAEKVK